MDYGWGEAIRLLMLLQEDPSTMVAARVRKWKHPLSREAASTQDLFDLQFAKTGAKNRKPYPRPWDDVEKAVKRGNRAGRSNAQVLELVRPA